MSDDDRSPYNGKPYYCDVCGLGFDEYMACELPDCRLEDEQKAAQRAAIHESVQENRAAIEILRDK